MQASIYTARPLSHSFSALFMRVCQPLPVARKASSTSGSRRIPVAIFGESERGLPVFFGAGKFIQSNFIKAEITAICPKAIPIPHLTSLFSSSSKSVLVAWLSKVTVVMIFKSCWVKVITYCRYKNLKRTVFVDTNNNRGCRDARFCVSTGLAYG
jgi:hypothetical protein